MICMNYSSSASLAQRLLTLWYRHCVTSFFLAGLVFGGIAQAEEFPQNIDGDIGLGTFYRSRIVPSQTARVSVLPYVYFSYGRAVIRVWNASGMLAASLEDVQPAGTQESELQIQSFAPGHYFYQVDLLYDSGRENRFNPEVLAVKR